MDSAVILAGGLGTRIRSVLGDTPKCLAVVHGKPVLMRQLELLESFGYKFVYLALGHGHEPVLKFLSELRFDGMFIQPVVETRALGTGGALSNIAKTLNPGTFLSLQGDTLFEKPSMDAIQTAMASETAETNIAFTSHDVQTTEGFAFYRDDFGLVYDLERVKSDRNPLSTGIYRWHAQALSDLTFEHEKFDIEETILPSLISRGLLSVVEIQGPFHDVGTAEGLAFANSHYSRHRT